ncbi:MAG: OmpA family protein [Crocinitomicaceae bacterium]|jgi:OmpA-OmpF porin, OOP family|nr:OmpA family protein [Crocinitomicaceae bacterium]MDP4740070.1 OmpA family protein [Crocinitomicaceae bacterium]MDP4799899.1 OmpA family protein [Crocinitomicaceae bacterium]MDP4805642.1 OmpA family protein [Crocinitomicaceae bacterium]MDP4867651.1 OmpA family protein [Crocinitomicaceae bacterium]
MKLQTTPIRSILVACSILALSQGAFAQKGKKTNEKEIVNITFEGASEDLTELNGIDAAGKGISSPTELKADLFSKSGTGDIGIPVNIYGSEEPTTENGGNVYAGIVAYKPGKLAGERSYITIQLMQGKEPVTLKKGLTYCIEYAVSLSESSKFACNNLGAYLSKDAPGNGEPGAIYMAGDHVMKAQLNKVYNGFFGWEKVCNTYTAKGDEKFITIGNFDLNDKTQFQAVKKPKDAEADPLTHAYYYIDNIIVRLVDSPTECACFNAKPPKIEDGFSTLVFDKTPEINDKMNTEKKIAAQTIYFRAGKTSLTENARANLDFIIAQMNANPAMKLEVEGHNDGLEIKAGAENEDYLDMDRKRVAAAVKYLTNNGIAQERIVKSYKSDTMPSAEISEDDDQEVKDAKNRRVEFRVKL